MPPHASPYAPVTLLAERPWQKSAIAASVRVLPAWRTTHEVLEKSGGNLRVQLFALDPTIQSRLSHDARQLLLKATQSHNHDHPPAHTHKLRLMRSIKSSYR
eukprot:7877505-Pyramimonas_sp.AAC.2